MLVSLIQMKLAPMNRTSCRENIMARSVTKSAQKGLHHKKHGAGHYVERACFIFILLITVFPFF